jgi:hypothetical protein
VKIVVEHAIRMTLKEFAELHDLVMEVGERPRWGWKDDSSRWHAGFRRTEVKGDGVLIGVSGNGPTPEGAIADYASKLPGETLVIDAYTDRRREILVPDLIPESDDPLDLIPKPVKHTRTVWLNIYDAGDQYTHKTKKDCDRYGKLAGRIACKEITFDYYEGEGLE